MNQVPDKTFLPYFKAAILLIVTFCLGYVMATGIARLLDRKDVANDRPAPENLRDVFVLKGDVGKGREISPDDFVVVQQPKANTPRGVVKTFQQIEGRASKMELAKGTVLLDDYFVPKMSQNNVAGYIPPGYHSVTVQVYESDGDQENSIRSMRPGDQVDILAMQTDPETGEKLDEILLLERIPVLETITQENDELAGNEKKGAVALLLSNSQKKHLQDEINEDMKIRLRICPTSETQTAGESGSQSLRQMVDRSTYSGKTSASYGSRSRNLSQTFNHGDITIEFQNQKTAAEDYESAGQVLKPLLWDELQIPAFREVPTENVMGNTTLSQGSILDNRLATTKLVQDRPAPRYSSFYDSTGQNGNTDMQWHVLSPRPPVVYEAKPGSQSQARGVYREGGVYISAE